MGRAGGTQPGRHPEDQLLAIFDIFDQWFHSDDFEASVFINVLFEMGPSHPTGRASIHYLENIRGLVATMAEEAHLRDPQTFARSWHILMQGSIVCAAEGDLEAATRAKALSRTLLDQHRQHHTPPSAPADRRLGLTNANS